jgi:hypothetical protein
MSALRGALSSLYAHNAAESKKAREDTRVSKIIRESDRQFYQQVVPCSQHFVQSGAASALFTFHSISDPQGPQSTIKNRRKIVQAIP